jgi:hypothetical protein
MRTLKRLKQLRDNPLAPLVKVGLLFMLAYCVFVFNLLTHGW